MVSIVCGVSAFQVPSRRRTGEQRQQRNSLTKLECGPSRLWFGHLVVVHSGDRPDVCVRRSIDSVWGMDAVHLQMARMDEGLVEVAAWRPSVTTRDQAARLVVRIHR